MTPLTINASLADLLNLALLSFLSAVRRTFIRRRRLPLPSDPLLGRRLVLDEVLGKRTMRVVRRCDGWYVVRLH
jgi:hypothetical protein